MLATTSQKQKTPYIHCVVYMYHFPLKPFNILHFVTQCSAFGFHTLKILIEHSSKLLHTSVNKENALRELLYSSLAGMPHTTRCLSKACISLY